MSSKNDLFNKTYVKHLFNSVSRSYDIVNFICSLGYSKRWRSKFIKKLPVNKNKIAVADLMCGMGECWQALLTRYPNAKITAIDFSEGMLAIAHKRNINKYNSQINLLHGDVLHNDLKENHFDIVVCAFGIKTISPSEMQLLAQRIYSILKPGGSFSIIETSIPQNKVIARLYCLYLKYFIPTVGKLFAGNQHYSALYNYTQSFNNAHKLIALFNTTGLSCNYVSYVAGCATGIYGRRPE
jgi:demethylmenaquinone methyltransferase/2-methoxy-6-polyprenyl-1,4-benzoquinol methylase